VEVAEVVNVLLAEERDVLDGFGKAVLETFCPKTRANMTTPMLLMQQSVLVPQHHLSLSARPVHGVIFVFPFVFFVSWHTSRQSPLATSRLVQ
jgi:hypothetical protein